MAIAQERLYTADDLWRMPDDGKIYELHSGVLIEVAGSAKRQTQLAAWLIILLGNFILEKGLGGALSGPDGTYVLSQFDTRIPDVAYVRDSQEGDPGFYKGAPDLAVEVVSPSNSPLDMQQRAGEYLRAGCRLVWIVDPQNKAIDVYRPDGSRLVRHQGDTLDGYDVLPGLALSVTTVFTPYGRAV